MWDKILEFLKEFFKALAATQDKKGNTLHSLDHMPRYGEHSEVVKKYQQALKDEGASPGSIDGVFGRKTKEATSEFQKSIGLKGSGEPGPKTIEALGLFVVKAEVPPPSGEGMTPYEWVRGELGQKEIYGSKDNPRIRWYHTASGNIGHKEYPDETPWCSSILNKAADECGYYKTDNALASSWRRYNVDAGSDVKQGDIVVIDGHVTLADKPFHKSKDNYFYGLGGNQSNMVKVSKYATSRIKAVRKWKKKGDITPAPRPPSGSKIKSIFPKQEWTDFVHEEVLKRGMAEIPLKDAKLFCPNGMTAENWVHLVAAMAKRESNFKASLEYKESFKDSKGRYVISTGLLQLSVESIRQSAYKSKDFIKKHSDLKDPINNLRAGLNVLEYWARKDGVLSEKRGKKWYGSIARYWSVGRDSLPKTLKILKDTCN